MAASLWRGGGGALRRLLAGRPLLGAAAGRGGWRPLHGSRQRRGECWGPGRAVSECVAAAFWTELVPSVRKWVLIFNARLGGKFGVCVETQFLVAKVGAWPQSWVRAAALSSCIGC